MLPVLKQQLTRPVLTQAHVHSYLSQPHSFKICWWFCSQCSSTPLKVNILTSDCKMQYRFCFPPVRKEREPSVLRKLEALSKLSAVASTLLLRFSVNQPSVRGCYSLNMCFCIKWIQRPVFFVLSHCCLKLSFFCQQNVTQAQLFFWW